MAEAVGEPVGVTGVSAPRAAVAGPGPWPCVRPLLSGHDLGALSGVTEFGRKQMGDVFGLKRWLWTETFALAVPHSQKKRKRESPKF